MGGAHFVTGVSLGFIRRTPRFPEGLGAKRLEHLYGLRVLRQVDAECGVPMRHVRVSVEL